MMAGSRRRVLAVRVLRFWRRLSLARPTPHAPTPAPTPHAPPPFKPHLLHNFVYRVPSLSLRTCVRAVCAVLCFVWGRVLRVPCSSRARFAAATRRRRRHPPNEHSPIKSLRTAVLFLASRDLHLAAAFARQFYW